MSPSISETAPAAASTLSKSSNAALLQRTSVILGRVIDACLYLVVFLVPLFFTTLTIDILELNKQTLLIVLVSVMTVAWLGKAVADKHFSLSRSWLHLVVALFGAAYLLVALFSQDRYLSMFGFLGQMPWSFTTIFSLILFYVVAVNRIRTLGQVYDLLLTFLASSLVAALFGFAQLFGWFLFANGDTHNRSFTSVGSLFSLAMYAVAPIVIAAGLVFHGCRDRYCFLGSDKLIGKIGKGVIWATLVVNFLILVVVDFWPSWVALLIGMTVTIGVSLVRSRKVKKPTALILPGILFVIALSLIFFKTPLKVEVPSEVAPSIAASWEIARQTLQSYPLFGSGPGTWIYDYARFRSPLVNQSPFWGMRFDRSFSAFFTLLATVGLFGVCLWLMLILSAIGKSATHLLKEGNDDVWHAYLTVFSGWFTIAVTGFLYNFNMPHQTAFWVLLALLGSLIARDAYTWDAKKNSTTFGIISAILILGTAGAFSAVWLSGQRFLADKAFYSGVRAYQSSQPFSVVVANVERAARLNPWSDMYARNLAQAHLVQLATLLQNKPKTDAENQAVIDEVNMAVELGKKAITLSSANVDNWTNLGMIYESVANFTKGADEYAINNYKEASTREPNNPVFLSEIGKLYRLRADGYRATVDGKNAKADAEAKKNAEDALKAAYEYQSLAIRAKSDFLPARYELGVVFERQGKIPESIAQLEEILQQDRQNTGVAFELALLYYRNNEKDRALNLLEQIIRYEEGATNAPKQVNARWYLAAIYEERGRLDEAIKQISVLLTQLPDNDAVKQRLDALMKERDANGRTGTKTLPEPLKEEVSGPAVNNPVKKK